MKKKLGIVIILLGLVFAVLVTGPVYVRADSGWDSDYDSGGSDYSSSSDYGSSGSSGGSGSISSSDDPIITTVGLIIFLIFVFSLIAESKNKNNKSGSSAIDLIYTDITDEQLHALLPNANLSDIKEEVYQVFIDVQNAWMEFDYDTLRKLCTDELYNTYTSQLDTLKIKNGKNIMHNFVLDKLRIYNIKEENGHIAIDVLMFVSFYDYVIDTTTNKVIRGHNDHYVYNKYLMTFVKTKDDDLDKCPACGAPIEDGTSTKCRYCRSELVTSSSKFVLSKKNIMKK